MDGSIQDRVEQESAVARDVLLPTLLIVFAATTYSAPPFFSHLIIEPNTRLISMSF
jgi:hypothetical protein